MAGTQSAVCREVCLKSTPLSIFGWTHKALQIGHYYTLSLKRETLISHVYQQRTASLNCTCLKNHFSRFIFHTVLFFLRLRIEHSLVLDIHFIRSISWMCWLTYQVYTNCNNTVDIANMIHTLKSFSDVRGI